MKISFSKENTSARYFFLRQKHAYNEVSRKHDLALTEFFDIFLGPRPPPFGPLKYLKTSKFQTIEIWLKIFLQKQKF